MCKDRQKSGFGRMSGRFSRIRVRRNRKNGETRETTDAAATGEWQPPCPPGCSGCPRRDAEQTAPPQLPPALRQPRRNRPRPSDRLDTTSAPTLRQARHNVRPGTLADLRLCCETNRRNRPRPSDKLDTTSATGSPAAPRPLAATGNLSKNNKFFLVTQIFLAIFASGIFRKYQYHPQPWIYSQ